MEIIFLEVMNSFDKTTTQGVLSPDSNREFRQEYLKNLFQIGLFSINIPEDYGGLGAFEWHSCRAVTKAAYSNASLGLLLADHFSSIYLIKTCFMRNRKKRCCPIWIPDII
ncbi:MAG: acyl-CoA dehydrogenase family protein [Ignavibacteria bacterium]|nr:acyl-CoA dehydrogenase family protein [Ignavibacteria bacterium]